MIMKFIQENWISLLALVIALAGGLPGIIEVLNHFKHRPIFRFTLENLIIGEMSSPETKAPKAMILLTGTASNEGTRPLSPAYFDLKAHLPAGWIHFEKMLIPPNQKFASSAQNIEIKEPHKMDLQVIKVTILEAMPLRGHLIFVSSKVTREVLEKNLKKLQLRLVCVDIFNKNHETNVALSLSNIDQTITYPKQGMTITPK